MSSAKRIGRVGEEEMHVITKRKKGEEAGTQMVLNLGQKMVLHTCEDCGLGYMKGVIDDEKQHTKYHRQYLNPLSFSTSRFPSTLFLTDSHGQSIIKLSNDQTRTFYKQLRPHLHRMYVDLGSDISELDSPSLFDRFDYLFLYLEQGRCSGMMMVTSRPLIKITQSLVTEEEKCVEHFVGGIGILKMWTHGLHRGRGIAAVLLDEARASVHYGMIVPRAKVSFTSLTKAGTGFARKYLASVGEWVYICSDEDH